MTTVTAMIMIMLMMMTMIMTGKIIRSQLFLIESFFFGWHEQREKKV